MLCGFKKGMRLLAGGGGPRLRRNGVLSLAGGLKAARRIPRLERIGSIRLTTDKEVNPMFVMSQISSSKVYFQWMPWNDYSRSYLQLNHPLDDPAGHQPI